MRRTLSQQRAYVGITRVCVVMLTLALVTAAIMFLSPSPWWQGLAVVGFIVSSFAFIVAFVVANAVEALSLPPQIGERDATP